MNEPSQPPPEKLPPPTARGFRAAVALLGLFILLAAAARAWLHFHTPLVPGMNGAYYLVQARCVLERGTPGIPDLPLTFYLHAAFAWLVQHLAGVSQADAIVFAVKLLDSILPPLVAVPLFWMGRRWTRKQGFSTTTVLVPAVFACLGAQALGMAGDFQKNSLGLIWLAALAPAAHVFLEKQNWRSALAPLGIFALLGLTHIGVLGAAIFFAAALVVCGAVVAGRAAIRKLLAVAGVGLAILAVAGLVVYLAYDPARVKRLVRTVLAPQTFASQDDKKHPSGFRPPAARPAMRPDGNNLPPGFGLPPNAPGLTLLRRVPWLPAALFLGVGGAGLAVAVARRKFLPANDVALALAAALTCAVLGGPFFAMDKAMRLRLIAAIPAALTFSFLLANTRWAIVRRALGALVLAATVFSAAIFLCNGGRHAIVSEETVAELRTLREFASPPESTLIVARHGLEWWVAWTLHTHIAHADSVAAEDWTRFKNVFYLVEKNNRGLPPRGAGGFRPGPPPDFPPDGRPQPFGPRPGMPPGGGPMGGMMNVRIPPGAEI
ncbi:MAG: hypothetical protein NTZ16_10820, partial [Verrucomicrobia bacterium]|nr:hypothetical protein [Verrucomicrobiota bacterium]